MRQLTCCKAIHVKQNRMGQQVKTTRFSLRQVFNNSPMFLLCQITGSMINVCEKRYKRQDDYSGDLTVMYVC